ncbi:hypothetical protein BH11ACT2_BH11ACT2_23400 [soil metagenome]
MSDDKKTDPYNGELPDDADLGSSNAKNDDVIDDIEDALPGDESGLKTDGSGPLP